MKDIIELAREVNNGKVREWMECHLFYPDELKRFAALVRAETLEEAAEEAMHWVTNISTHSDAEYVAAAILALKEKT